MLLLRALDDLEKTPTLVFADRARLHDANDVADLGVVGLVVRLEAHRLADDLLVGRMGNARLGHHDDRLVHFVALDAPLFDAAGRPAPRRWEVSPRYAAPCDSSRRFSLMTV